MSYCTTSELLALTGTELAEEVLEEIIAQADREVGAQIYSAGLTPPGSDDALKAASLKFSIAGVVTRHRMDGTAPGTLTVGDQTASDDPDTAIDALRAEAKELVRGYIVRTKASTRGTWVKLVNG